MHASFGEIVSEELSPVTQFHWFPHFVLPNFAVRSDKMFRSHYTNG